MSESSIHSLKQWQDTLTASKEDLGRLEITKLREALTKLVKLLKFAAKPKGNQEAVKQLIDLVERLNQTTLAPILEAKKDPKFSVSESLKCNLCTLFDALDVGIPKKSQSSGLSLYFSGVDTGSVVLEANSKIEDALNVFVQQGEIVKSGVCHLVQAKPSSEGGSTSKPASNRGHMQAQAGPSGASQSEKLPSQVQRALDQCPRFRILLLGKSGAGKSSLINKVFGVSSAEIANYQAGRAVISQEHTSKLNPYFVLHDSMGFESGSQKQYQIVEDFIQDRNSRPELTEKLHAIWLCTAIPVSGGRVFETGDEQIFSLKLGNVPLIVVFTQYDNLVTKAEMDASYTSTNLDETQARAKADEYFEDLCAQPLKKICAGSTDREMPRFTNVSITKGYENTLLGLIRLTRELLPADAIDQLPPDMGYQPAQGPSRQAPDAEPPRTQATSTAGITLAIAQRIDPVSKIDAIIAIGRQRYWWGLASSFDFSGQSLKRCITVVHDDIIQVWNFLDPEMYLDSEAFKALMTKIVDDDAPEHIRGSSTAKLAVGFSGGAGVTGMAAALAPPSALIVGPLAIAAVFAKWIYGAYQQSPEVVRYLMTYIVDTTIVMQRLFWLMQAKGGIHPVPEELVVQAAEDYKASTEKNQVHRSIEQFVKKAGIFQAANKGVVFAEIARLIRSHRFEQPVAPPQSSR